MLAWLAQVDLRQHLQTRDFFPDDVSELSSVAAVEDAVDGGGATDFVVVVVAVVRIGCRQQDEEDTDVDAATVAASTVLALEVAAAAAGAGDFTVFTGSFLLVPCTAVFNIFSSPSAVGPCRAATIVHRGHSPTLKGCSSLL